MQSAPDKPKVSELGVAEERDDLPSSPCLNAEGYTLLLREKGAKTLFPLL